MNLKGLLDGFECVSRWFLVVSVSLSASLMVSIIYDGVF